MSLAPEDMFGLDINSPKLTLRGKVIKLSEHSTGAAAKIEYPLPWFKTEAALIQYAPHAFDMQSTILQVLLGGVVSK
jgi:hypothetical protein